MPLHSAGWVDSEIGVRPACSLTRTFSLAIVTTNETSARSSIRLFFVLGGIVGLSSSDYENALVARAASGCNVVQG